MLPESYCATAWRHEAAPVVIELPFKVAPMAAARKLACLPHLLLLESVMPHDRLGRYSFLMADPVEWARPAAALAMGWLDHRLQQFATAPHADLPPFQGGVAGLLSYEFGLSLEKVAAPPRRDLSIPCVALGLFDVVLAWDHVEQRCWLISQGHSQDASISRAERAGQRADLFQRLLEQEPASIDWSPPVPCSLDRSVVQAVPAEFGMPGLASNFDPASYRHTIRRALKYICAGDVFQVNVAQRLMHVATTHSLDLYERLRLANPAPFAGYIDLGDVQVVSASPERLVSLRDRVVETRPIKGTRPRTRRPEVDLDVGRQLQASEKDGAENVMIVDLMRNDLSRVCEDNSVVVTQLLKLESYAAVLHLVSAVEGRLRDNVQAGDLVKAVFPGGSVTGAPKIRAMEIISELEQVRRGAYCGSLGYFGLDGSVDLNILIRTITAGHGWWQIPVGGGIVAGSDPADEYRETWTKAAAMLASLK
jgi:para-aminobenzoate synthetase component 1